MRATNKGLSVRLAARLRALAEMLEHKKRDEFTREEIAELQVARKLITTRLYTNACAKASQLVLDGKCPKVDGTYRIDLNPKDL
jgi:hypothetical protein